jgi:hypothetical protein
MRISWLSSASNFVPMNRNLWRALAWSACVAWLALLTGCSAVYQRTHAYLGTPHYPPSNPATVQILLEEPKQPKERLGEISLTVEGEPKREAIENKLKEGAAKLGADAVFIVYDKVHVYPLVYYDWWWGPMGTTETSDRRIVGVAIKYK